MAMKTAARLSAPSVARIAAACGVSAMTVSRALRPDAPVAEPTRQRILAMAAAMGYRLHPGQGRPRRPASRQRPVVDVVLGTSIAPESQFAARLLIAVEQGLARRSHDCVIRGCGDDFGEFTWLCEGLRRSRASGTLVVGHFPLPQLRTILELVPAAILVDNQGHPLLAHTGETVAYDNVEAARLAVRHLLDLGRRRILLLTGPADHYFSRSMDQGYREVLTASALPLDPALLQTSDYTSRGAAQLLRQLLAEGLAFDAVCTNDEMAFGVLRALHDAGRRIPGDVAVAGCDGLPMGEVSLPSLTTVALDPAPMAELAVARLFAQLAAPAPPCRLQLLPRLIVRESTLAHAPGDASCPPSP